MKYRNIGRTSQIDFMKLGQDTMEKVGDENVAKEICGLHIHALDDELRPEITDLAQETEHVNQRRRSLWTHLYDREVPVSDAIMLGNAVNAAVLAALIVFTWVASSGTHMLMFNLIGKWLPLSIILGLALTGLTTAVGYRAHQTILRSHRMVELMVTAVAFALMLWGLFDIAQARGPLLEKLTMTPQATSFVDENGTAPASDEEAHPDASIEAKVTKFLNSGQMKIMLAADLVLGILLGILIDLWTDEDFVAWQNLKNLSRELRAIARRLNELLASIEIAKKRCMAGILQAKHRPRKRHLPFHLPVFVLAVLLVAMPLHAQTVNREEAVLIDVSGSVGRGAANTELFREYLTSVKKLLLTEPSESRVWVSIVTTDSFGSVRSIVKGWTPEVKGIFDDDLRRARRELAASFETRSAGLKPIATETDIIGGLWQAKALLESGSEGDSISKTIWIFSDMMNESAKFNMPALLPAGPEAILARAKANGLVVPLHGYRVHVVGASPAGLTPEAWNTLRTFWRSYFREAGAELVSYSAECEVERK